MLSILPSRYGFSHTLQYGNSPLQAYGGSHINAAMEFKDRLKAARRHGKVTQADLAKKLGIDQSSISNLESGKSASSSYSYQIAKICGVNPDWLVMGIGEMVEKVGLAEPDGSYEVMPGPAIGQEKIPIISYVRAGDFCEAEDPFEPGEADDWLPFRPPGAGPRTYALRVEGESNDPRIRNGEVVIVDPDRPPDPGKYVVAKRHSDSKVTLKQLSIAEGEYFLKPGNPNWPEPIIKVDGDWSICGVVIGKYDPM